MRIIQTGLIIAGLVVASAGFADQGVSDFGPTPEMSAQGAYLGVDIGAANVKYADILTSGTSGWSFGNWSAAFGGNLGYQFNTYMAIELGGAYMLPSKKGNLHIKPWYAFLAAKIMVPLYRDAVLFAKAGVNYVYQSTTGADAAVGSIKSKASNWGPMFAVGAAYNFTDNWAGNITYTRLSGKFTKGYDLPSFNVVTGGFSYKFTI